MKTTFKNITLTSTFLGNKKWGCDSNNYNNHRITVYNRDTNKRTSFEFWGSIVKPEITEINELGFSFYCFLSDGISALENSFDDFCCEFGYDVYNKESKRIYNACKKSAEKIKRVFSNIDYYDLINEVQEAYNC